MKIQSGLRYTKDHEWAKIEGGVARVGISAFAIEQLGDITLVEAPKKGSQIKAGETVGTVESVKAVSDIYAPLSGEVVEVNDALIDAPEQLNEDSYAAWIYAVRLANEQEAAALYDAAGYEAYLKTLDH